MAEQELGRRAEILLTATHISSFEMGVAACRAALVREFGEDSDLTAQITDVVDAVVVAPYQLPQESSSRTISVRPNPPIIPAPGAPRG